MIRHPMISVFGLACALAGLMSVPTAARATYTPLYANTTNFSGYGYASGVTASSSGVVQTAMVADDINAGAGLGGYSVDQLVFSVYSANTTAVSARADVRIFASDGANGGPGTLILALDFNAISFAASSVATYTYDSAGMFTMPTGTFWASVSFDNSGTTATAAQLKKLGQGLFTTPTVGTSADEIFQSTSAGSFLSNNPAGTIYSSPFGGAPVGNFGFEFDTLSVVPEPSSLALLGVAGAAFFGRGLIRRRRAR